MKAIRVHGFGGPEVLQMGDVVLGSPASHEVLVAVASVGVNPVDTYIRSGSNPNQPLPYTPGLDAAGTVVAVGSEVERVRVGQRVYVAGSLTGTYAEATLCRDSQVHPLPDNLSFEQGAAIGVPYATAYRALFHRAAIKPGESILIHGASGCVGTALLQLVKSLGGVVVGTAGTAIGVSSVLANGAVRAFNHTVSGYLTEAHSVTGGKGFDIVFEMLANVNLGNVLPLLSRNGRVVVIGSRGKVEITPRDLMSREADIRGMSLFNVIPSDLQEIHRQLHHGFIAGALKPIVARRFPLDQASRAHIDVMSSAVGGKIVITT